MPELPELEILRAQLDRDLGGRKVKAVEVTVPALTKRGGTRKQFVSQLEGVKMTGARRIGLWLVIALDSDHVLAISLGEGAQLRRTTNRDEVVKGTSLTITFTQHGQLRLVDPSKTSEAFVGSLDDVVEAAGVLGQDLAAEPVSWTAFGERLVRRTGKLKAILMDPTFLVGVGPMYSDEILFESGLRFDRITTSLSTQEIRRLYRATVAIIHDAIKYGGTTVGADGFVDLVGKPGTYQLAVYKRDGELSPRARGAIIKTRFGSGYTYYCEQTQM